MKVNSEFIRYEIDEEIMMIPIGKESQKFRGVIRMNKTADYIVSCINQGMTNQEIISCLESQYNGTISDFEESIQITISKLREVNALLEE